MLTRARSAPTICVRHSMRPLTNWKDNCVATRRKRRRRRGATTIGMTLPER
jgi:hypothetical protein